MADRSANRSMTVSFCGEDYEVAPTHPFTVGREGDLLIDDNPYLHRHFLEVRLVGDMWWLTNLGARLSATVCDADGLMQAWLAPGARLPVVFARTVVLFTAGPTTYEVMLMSTDQAFRTTPNYVSNVGSTTLAPQTLTHSQKLLVVALAEPLLRQSGRGVSAIPTSAQAAEKLGWTLTRFNRKLDNVCDKLTRAGERGLHGRPGRLATNRRARLVEFAIASRLVVRDDLELLRRPPAGEPVSDVS